ncbi:MAG: SIS domain-containing protein [Subdoligranulum sp.]|nr:SIS domain-containing protein [Subdoligranulum sp.]
MVSTIAENMSLLEALCQPQTLQAVYRAADLLRKAKKIYVIGNGSSYSISYMLGFMLSRMYSNVQLLERSADVMHISNFCDAQKEDCLIAVGYSRYTKATFDTLSFFHEKGCSIIAITDSVSSPLALMASEVLIAPRDSYFGPVSATALCSCLIAALAQHDASQMLERMEMQDALAESYGLYL